MSASLELKATIESLKAGARSVVVLFGVMDSLRLTLQNLPTTNHRETASQAGWMRSVKVHSVGWLSLIHI